VASNSAHTGLQSAICCAPVLTYLKYAALRCSQITLFGSVWPEFEATRSRFGWVDALKM